MTANIMLAILYGILTTFLVHPWYIKGILKGKTLFKNYNDYYNISLSLRNTLYFIAIIEFFFIFLLTLTSYNCGNSIFFPFIPAIILTAMFAMQIAYIYIVYDFLPFINLKKYTIIAIVTIFLVITFMQSSCNFKNITIPNIYEATESTFNISYFIPRAKLKFDSVADIVCYNDENNDYYLYTNTQSKIGIIDNTNLVNSKSLTINNSLTFSAWNDGIRSIFKSEQIEPYGIIITDKNKVYKVFYIIDTKPFSTKFNFSSFILVDCENKDIITI